MLQTSQATNRPRPAKPLPLETETRLATYKSAKQVQAEIRIGRKLSKILDAERVRRVRSIRDRMSNASEAPSASRVATPDVPTVPTAAALMSPSTAAPIRTKTSTVVKEPVDEIIYIWDVFRRKSRNA
ncbi:MAG: hypothetical protein AAGJ70_08880 [Pseudomonadota bacterium]